ncbi:hypothetical protein A3E97_01570 [Candidatus Uhrbacteria bacterium RIFCSPHIGHO2_12_FULL_47_12]|uniref:Uncharacterized protein n=1 Tax=Candidatus Uhrbacteria bacterium RIFCSPLOWO2_02_FULL_48_18 TaxID=1802408 RepID=A0A1F7VCS5_9BACT|nr:MAG: hypothetical protein A3E97_01570 [Candidatus Uhrbacteria bacterium RIFCSPHIGHO2_12_FULL_47_12]OGL80584.1 MAG: hypothetical protein A3B20_04260 [Candidatus Uhrbacteria bacterium RIFCSPLOWO2_01_FULL_47_17]OGL88233.1 MAG: hypothetical protein A3I41_00720 [Candidatus Uhrbacteria bacterium RIFCSPLOWO2_02_FULL_48_18]OGL94248.1 MAG: hypothetical protein A3H12_02585 [Candidatus Uhrbacteria bacterium RIFCSPLOWO2_12_FULL_47_9]
MPVALSGTTYQDAERRVQYPDRNLVPCHMIFMKFRLFYLQSLKSGNGKSISQIQKQHQIWLDIVQ